MKWIRFIFPNHQQAAVDEQWLQFLHLRQEDMIDGDMMKGNNKYIHSLDTIMLEKKTTWNSEQGYSENNKRNYLLHILLKQQSDIIYKAIDKLIAYGRKRITPLLQTLRN